MNRSRLRLHHPRRLFAKCVMAAQLRREKRSEGLAASLSRITAEQKLRFCRLKSGLERRGGLFRTGRRHFASLVHRDRTTGVTSRGYRGTFHAHWENDKIYLFQIVSWLWWQSSANWSPQVEIPANSEIIREVAKFAPRRCPRSPTARLFARAFSTAQMANSLSDRTGNFRDFEKGADNSPPRG